jgi:hypothetical protein
MLFAAGTDRELRYISTYLPKARRAALATIQYKHSLTAPDSRVGLFIEKQGLPRQPSLPGREEVLVSQKQIFTSLSTILSAVSIIWPELRRFPPSSFKTSCLRFGQRIAPRFTLSDLKANRNPTWRPC